MTTLKPCPVLELSSLFATVTERCCTCPNRVLMDLEQKLAAAIALADSRLKQRWDEAQEYRSTIKTMTAERDALIVERESLRESIRAINADKDALLAKLDAEKWHEAGDLPSDDRSVLLWFRKETQPCVGFYDANIKRWTETIYAVYPKYWREFPPKPEGV